jgi:hypothetical protein
MAVKISQHALDKHGCPMVVVWFNTRNNYWSSHSQLCAVSTTSSDFFINTQKYTSLSDQEN